MYTLDEIDRRILIILQDDSRTPFSEIARRVNLSETAVRYRISKLKENHVVDRFAAILNPRAVGYPISAIILVKGDHRFVKGVFDKIAALSATSHVVQTTGEYDLVAVVHTKDNVGLNELATRIRGIKGVKEASVWITTGLYKLDFRFKLD